MPKPPLVRLVDDVYRTIAGLTAYAVALAALAYGGYALVGIGAGLLTEDGAADWLAPRPAVVAEAPVHPSLKPRLRGAAD